MAMDSGGLLMLGAAAVGGYLLYENWSSCNAADWITLIPGLPSGWTPTLANVTALATTLRGQPGDLLFKFQEMLSTAVIGPGNATAADIAALNSVIKCMLHLGIVATAPAASNVATSTMGTTVGAVTNPPATAPAATPVNASVTNDGAAQSSTPASASLASIWSAIQAGAATDPNFISAGGIISGTPYRWNVYLGIAYPAAANVDLTQVFPGTDLTQNMSGSVYWAGMSRYLTGQYGLSGLGVSSDPLAAFNAAQTPSNNDWSDASLGTGGQAFDFLMQSGGMPIVGDQTPYNPPDVTNTPKSSNTSLWLLGGVAAVAAVALFADGGRRR